MGYKMILFRMIYEEGLDDVKKNYERAFEYYYEACNRNVAEGFKKLSIMYRYVKEWMIMIGSLCKERWEKGWWIFKEGRIIKSK